MTERQVILVDPYAGAADYADAFRARGVTPVAVLTTPTPLPAYHHTWAPDRFHTVHHHTGDLAALVRTVRAHDPLAVIPGNESGVLLSDALTQELWPGTGNDPELSEARRDKWPMARALERAGVPHPRTLSTADEEEAANWLRETGLTSRALVLKPRRSGGTDAVRKVEPGEDWRPSFRALLGSVNRFGLPNDTVLLQEFAAGTEFAVDTYSVDGELGIVSVAQYTKSTRADRIGIYDAVDYLSPDDPRVAQLGAYTRDVARAVGIRTGCAHTEIMLTEDGPRLVETAARLAGSCLQHSARLATGDCQIDRTVRHLLDGEFTRGFVRERPTRVLWLSAPHAGTLRGGTVLDEARELPTFQRLGRAYPDGAHVPRTEDLFTSLGWVLLAGDTESAVDADTAAVRDIESRLPIEPSPPNPRQSRTGWESC
ncbi:ATP-grasp domain-containing protein [Streptomyces sp. AJS327]|uniref:ATP-grasp domain-containing protein n=1 Tax=Streptomyces sp. AJS327 TaxID=2545265 RepID=UPI0015DE8DA7|nr:ATP-grasp domain-containing protein [Streptomyces sp. AJS327]MBA0053309.1 ATP-grasp domain-containing protein [Streptomyces sp. AJS327]